VGLSDSDAQILYFIGSLVLATALLGVTIYYARQNKRMADEMTRQRQISLYDRRVKIVGATREHLAMAGQRGELTHEQVTTFAVNVREAASLECDAELHHAESRRFRRTQADAWRFDDVLLPGAPFGTAGGSTVIA
jgi:hypothetical protein